MVAEGVYGGQALLCSAVYVVVLLLCAACKLRLFRASPHEPRDCPIDGRLAVLGHNLHCCG